MVFTYVYPSMENSDVLAVCAFNSVWQIARRSDLLMKALENTKWTELVTLFDDCNRQDNLIVGNQTLGLLDRALQGEKVEIPDSNLVCAVEVCARFFGHVLAQGYELIGEEADARDVMVLLIEKIWEEKDKEIELGPCLPLEEHDQLLNNNFCMGEYEFQLPATPGGNPSTVTEAFKLLSVGYPAGIGIQRAFDKWMVNTVNTQSSSDRDIKENTNVLPFKIRKTFKKLPPILLVACDEIGPKDPPRKPMARADVDSLTLKQQNGVVVKYKLIGLSVYRERHWIGVIPDAKDSWFCYDDVYMSPMDIVDDVALLCYERLK